MPPGTAAEAVNSHCAVPNSDVASAQLQSPVAAIAAAEPTTRRTHRQLQRLRKQALVGRGVDGRERHSHHALPSVPAVRTLPLPAPFARRLDEQRNQ